MPIEVAITYLVGSASKKHSRKLLKIEELIDIDMEKFEEDNNTKLNYIIYQLLDQSINEASASKPVASKSASKPKKPKKKASDYHMNVGHSKRIDPLSEEEKRVARMKWEKINFKKDHLIKFTKKDKQHRVL